MNTYQFTVEIKDGKFLEFKKEQTNLLPMDIIMEIDSKCVGRGIGVYEQFPDESDVTFEDRIKSVITAEYEGQKRNFKISNGVFG